MRYFACTTVVAASDSDTARKHVDSVLNPDEGSNHRIQFYVNTNTFGKMYEYFFSTSWQFCPKVPEDTFIKHALVLDDGHLPIYLPKKGNGRTFIWARTTSFNRVESVPGYVYTVKTDKEKGEWVCIGSYLMPIENNLFVNSVSAI